MKRTEIKELQAKTIKELWDMLKKLNLDLMKLRMDLAQNKVGNTRALARKNDDVARIKTVLRLKELAKK